MKNKEKILRIVSILISFIVLFFGIYDCITRFDFLHNHSDLWLLLNDTATQLECIVGSLAIIGVYYGKYISKQKLE